MRVDYKTAQGLSLKAEAPSGRLPMTDRVTGSNRLLPAATAYLCCTLKMTNRGSAGFFDHSHVATGPR